MVLSENRRVALAPPNQPPNESYASLRSTSAHLLAWILSVLYLLQKKNKKSSDFFKKIGYDKNQGKGYSMKKAVKFACYALFFGVLSVYRTACADSDFESWKKKFYQEAYRAGISAHVLDQTVPRMQLLERVIRLDTDKPKYLPNFYDYTGARITDNRVQKGREMMQKYPTWLGRVEQKYGVPREYLVAFWGMETNYGGYKGKVNMLDSLASLAYHPRRQRFFTNELIAYLKIIEHEPTVAPALGSWDGGFGHFQFMPTTFLAYAVDGDGNGRRDIVNNIPDAFSSAANYLASMGWNKNEPWGREVIVPENFPTQHLHQHTKKTVADWYSLGVQPRHITAFPAAEQNTMAELHMPMGIHGPVFLAYPNFRIIMRWNKSELYAFAVGLLADSLRHQIPCPKPPPEFQPLETEYIICMQDALRAQGYLSAGSDGRVGPKTRQALRRFQLENDLFPDGYPNIKLIEKLGCYNK